MDSIDDRGNVVDIYIDDDRTGVIDREVEDLDNGQYFSYGFNGGEPEMQIAIKNGYENDLAIAILCEFIRGDAEAKQHAKEFISIYFNG